MTLSEYLKREELSLTDFASQLGVTKGWLSQVNNRGGDWPPELALTAEEKTGGVLDASQLSSIIARARQAAA